MKNLIYLLALAFFMLACDNSIVEPTYLDSNELQKSDSQTGEFIGNSKAPRKTYRSVNLSGEYSFNPDALDKNCGGFLTKNHAKYQYENEEERSIRNLKIYSPSRMVVGNKAYKTISVYTINKYETLSPKGVVQTGKTWGSFTVHIDKKSIKFDEESNYKFESSVKNELGPIILSGQFSGKIDGVKTTVEWKGNGHNDLKGSKLVAKERMICGSDFCWKSNITGTVKIVDFRDE